VLLWLVLLSFDDDEVASFELVCVALSAAAVPTWTNASVTAARAHSSAKHHRMPPASVLARARPRPRLSVWAPPGRVEGSTIQA
jgi:hypothetical protein